MTSPAGSGARSPDRSYWSDVRWHLRRAGPGIVAVLIAAPFLLNMWAPRWFWIAWDIAYLFVSVAFIFLAPMFGRTLVATWTLATACLTSVLLMSATVGPWVDERSPFVAVSYGFAYLLFELSTLPERETGNWWLGIVVVGIMTAVTGWIAVHPVVGLAMVLVGLGVADAARRSMNSKIELDQRLAEAERLTRTDPLTGLMNRRGFSESIAALAQPDATIAIYDLDRFKAINDVHGHDVGDHALRKVATHLRNQLGSGWHLARLGGDEFVAIAPGHVSIPSGAAGTVPVSLGADVITVSLSVGVATGWVATPEHADRLLTEAEHALRHAKRSSASRAVLSTGWVRGRYERSVRMASFDGHRLPVVPFGQVIRSADGVVGVELLARWRAEEGRLLLPSQFLDILEERGMVQQLDDTMLEHAARFAAQLGQDSEGAHKLFVSVNVSPSRLLDAGLPTSVQSLLERHGVKASQMVIEIVESERLSTDGEWEATARRLRELGVRLSIDDFGAGYSNLARLQRLPIGQLKIDRSLVGSLDDVAGEIIRGVTRFCHRSSIDVVAEGIESERELSLVKEAGISIWQGYLFGKPRPVDEVLASLADHEMSLPTGEHAPANEVST